MNLHRRALLFALLCVSPLARGAAAEGLQSLDFTVDGATRTALVYVPPGANAGPLPVVFVFHGHDGTACDAWHAFGIDGLWPQDLNTPSKPTDPEGLRPDWQKTVGDQNDRDLHFFDALLARLKHDRPVDPERIYCTGHSNGAGFTYLLWLARPDVFAAVAPCSGAAAYVGQLSAKPAMILAGRDDTLVKFEWQEMMLAAVRKIDGCEESGVPWEGVGTLYPSKGGTPLVTYVYLGGHAMDRAEPGLIVKFFQEHPRAANLPAR